MLICLATFVVNPKTKIEWPTLIVFWIYIAVVIAILIFVFTASMLLGLPQQSPVMNAFAQAMGYIPVVLSFVQWTPQIIKTWRTKVSAKVEYVTIKECWEFFNFYDWNNDPWFIYNYLLFGIYDKRTYFDLV